MPAARTILAADLGGTKLSVALVDARGRILARQTEPVDASKPHAPINQILRQAKSLAENSRRKFGSFAAAGVAIPGLVRPNGTVWAPNLPGWERIPLARLLRERLRVPVVVESDRNAAVLGEAWRGAARAKTDVIALLVGTGIGAGILSGGRLIRGAHELSGCAGWMVITEEEEDEFLRVGCLEALTAGPAIARAAREALSAGAGGELAKFGPGSLTALDVATAARRGDDVAHRIFEQAGRRLGLAVANLISLFDPQVVVLGGGLAGAAELFLDALERAARARAQPLAAPKVRIVTSRLGADANLLGAARLAWDATGRRAS